MALVVSVVLADLIGGPGAIAVPAPALLWCAIRYPFFATAALTLAVCLWQMVVFVDIVGVQDEGQDAVYAAMSIRLGLALLALGPLTVSSVIQAHNALVRRLGQVISHDSLTGALSRTGFLDQGRQLACARSDVCVIMFDLDDFKHVNDRLGHAVGDIALVGFAGVASSQLRSGDILGRVGGEEFAAILCGVEMATAMQIAERIRAETERLVIDVEGKEPLRITVSAGLAMGGPDLPLERLMIAADAALYEAKRAGRNRVAISSGRDEPAAAIGAKRNAA